jgi:hypothetical protein
MLLGVPLVIKTKMCGQSWKPSGYLPAPTTSR